MRIKLNKKVRTALAGFEMAKEKFQSAPLLLFDRISLVDVDTIKLGRVKGGSVVVEFCQAWKQNMIEVKICRLYKDWYPVMVTIYLLDGSPMIFDIKPSDTTCTL